MSHTLTKYQFMVTGEYSDRNFPAKNEKKKKRYGEIKLNKLPNSLKLHL